MANADSPGSGSALSDIDSDQFTEDLNMNRSRSNSNASSLPDVDSDGSTSTPRLSGMPPAKRRRTGASTYDHPTPRSSSIAPPRSPSGSVSSDSSGSLPTSPSFAQLAPTHPLSTAYTAAQANPDNPEAADYIQVTRCQWEGCSSPEQGNMDNLVQHINDVHIRQKKYLCEWEGCTRKSMPHGSAYALKAHMRSHTKEKPFMCQLPECDRSFTRSDALAKHMRTVHETEALRPSDPVPRGHTGGISTATQGANGTLKRIKLVMGGQNGDKKQIAIGELPPLPNRSTVARVSKFDDEPRPARLTAGETSDPELEEAVDIDSVPFQLPVADDYYPEDISSRMEDYEFALPPSQYFRLIRRQIEWALEEGIQLTKELADLRATTDDHHGRPIKIPLPQNGASKDGTRTPPDERVGDEIRREEGQYWEALTNHILKADLVAQLLKKRPKDTQALNALIEESNPWKALASNKNLEFKSTPKTNGITSHMLASARSD